MKTLLAIEWLKIKRYRTFWILVGFFIVLLPLLNYQIQNGMVQLGGNAKDGGINLLSQAYTFPEVWGNVGFWGSVFVLFLSILVIILTTNEYNFRTHRQNVIDGWSRLQFYHAKIGLVVLISMLATLYLFLVGAVLGIAADGDVSYMFNAGYKLGYFFLLTLNYLGFALLIGLWIRRSGLAIGLFLLYSMIIEHILEAILNWKISFNPGNFLPLQASDELLPFPMMKMAQSLMPGSTTPESYFVIASIAWCAVYYFIGRRLLLRSDW